MRRPFGRSCPCVEWTSRMLCVSFALPAATAPESIVRRCGWYQAVPSRLCRPHPENITSTDGADDAGAADAADETNAVAARITVEIARQSFRAFEERER